jgi:hypothetical protein
MKKSNHIGFNRSEFVELEIRSTGVLRHMFSEIDNLRGKSLLSIDSFFVSQITKTPTGKDIINTNALRKAYLVLVSNGKEAINRIPLIALIPSENQGRRISFSGMQIDWVKSYVEFADTANLVQGEALLFNCYFQEETC